MVKRSTPGITGARGLCCLLIFFTLLSEVFARMEMEIGVLAFRGKQDALDRWTPTADYLSEEVLGYRFKIVPLTLEGMGTRVEQDNLDFILTNTGNYVVLEYAFGISRLATLKVRHLGRDFTQFGAVIFTRHDHPVLNNIEQITGHSMMAVSEIAFGGFQMAWREMIESGVDPFEDLTSLEFNGFPQDDIVNAVIDAKVDVGTVRSGTLERMAVDKLIDISKIKVLGSRQSRDFPFLHSTRLYPEWPFAKARKTPEALAQRVAVALLEMEPDNIAAQKALAAGWTIPLDYGPVHELFRKLEIGPYQNLGKPSLESVWREFKTWILFSAAMILILVVLIVLIARANRRISQSELKYREEANQRRQAQELLAEHKVNLEASVRQRTAELAEANTSLRRSESTLRAIHDITTDSDIDFDTKLKRLLNEGCRFFQVEFAATFRIDDSGLALATSLHIGDTVGLQNLTSMATSMTLELQHGDDTLVISDLRNYRFENDTGGIQFESGCFLGTGYIVDDRISGYLLFCDSRAGTWDFSEVDVDILQLMAQWLGGEIERGKAYRRAQEHQVHLAHVARLNTMGAMATGIAHELNQPLTAILNYSNGCLRLLKKDGSRDRELLEAITKVGNDANRAAGIIRRLREFIKRGELKRERFLIRDCIEPAVALLRPRLDQQKISVDLYYGDNVSYITADRIQIEQVVVNLMINAIDALQAQEPGAKEIFIKITNNSAEYLSVEISNSGAGVADDVVPRLFDPFFTTKSEGMGMGLSISRSIVESHGGCISYQINDNAMPTFVFTLPLM